MQSIKADLPWILDTNIINYTNYYYDGFFISGLSSTSGYRSIGTCYIPSEITKVRIRTAGLQAYFYNEDFWVKFNEINTTESL